MSEQEPREEPEPQTPEPDDDSTLGGPTPGEADGGDD
jgi:hypothetical protein